MHLSIILPSYNVASYIERAVESLLVQDVEGYEIIIVDDGSTDNLLDKCKQWDGTCKVKVIHTQNQGVSEARNVGFREARGEYIYFMDPDDWIEENVLGDILNICRENSGDAIRFGYRKKCGSRVVESEDDGGVNICDGEEIRRTLLPKYIGCSLDELSAFDSKDFGKDKELSLVWRFIFKRDTLLKNNIFFEKGLSFMEDKLFLCKFFCYAERLVIYNKICYNYCVREDGLMKTNFKNPVKFAEQRILAEKCRLALVFEYKKTWDVDIEPMFQGTLVLASIQLLLQMIKGFKFGSLNYVREFMSIPSVIRAFDDADVSRFPITVRMGYSLLKRIGK